MMSRSEFMKEHKRLLKALKTEDPKLLHDEYKIQMAEMRERLRGGRAGVSKASGFIQRLMAENKKKHTGSYTNPTYPLAADSTMNKAFEFKYKKLASAGQGGENQKEYGASPFITKHFSKAMPEQGAPAPETTAQRAARMRTTAGRLLKMARGLAGQPEDMPRLNITEVDDVPDETETKKAKVKGFLKDRAAIFKAKNIAFEKRKDRFFEDPERDPQFLPGIRPLEEAASKVRSAKRKANETPAARAKREAEAAQLADFRAAEKKRTADVFAKRAEKYEAEEAARKKRIDATMAEIAAIKARADQQRAAPRRVVPATAAAPAPAAEAAPKTRMDRIKSILRSNPKATLRQMAEGLAAMGDLGREGKPLGWSTLSPQVAKARKELTGSGGDICPDDLCGD
jgi:hypothetical protein